MKTTSAKSTATVDANFTTLYMNRIQLAQSASQNVGANGVPFQIGYVNGFNNVFVGDMAEIIVYNRALTPTELSDVTYALEQTYGIPEPASAAILAAGGLMLASQRRRWRRR